MPDLDPVLPIGIGLDQAGIDRKVLPAYQTLVDAACRFFRL